MDNKTYYIKVEYTTGDSFETHETTENIELFWHNIDIANENLKRLREQVNLYDFIENWQSDTKNAIEIWSKKEWAVFDSNNAHWTMLDYKTNDGRLINPHSIKLLDDNCKEIQISTSTWTGYFESKQYFKIEEKE